MTFWKRNRSKDRDAELDATMTASRASFIAHYNATFDFEAGLDDVYARAGLDRMAIHQDAAATPADEFEVDVEHGALQQVCDRITMIDTLLVSITRTDAGPVVTGFYLTMCRQLLLQLRTGLQARRLSLRDALDLIVNVRHNLREIDQLLRRHHGLSLDEALHDRIGELMEIGTDMTGQMQTLENSIVRLFDAAGEPAVLTPVP
jgi:hypothetical protein